MPTLNAVPIHAEPVDSILDGKKVWEIRSRPTLIRGRIGLIKSGSKTVVGTCKIVDVIGPLTARMVKENARAKMDRAPRDCADCVGAYASVLADVRRLVQPVPYKHRPGAITWVKLDEAKAAEVLGARSVRAGVRHERVASVKAPPARRELLFLKQAGDLEIKADKDSLVHSVGDHLVAIMNERRAAKGLPPLAKTKAEAKAKARGRA